MTLTVTPTYPAAGQEVALSTSLGDAASARFELTGKPTESRLAVGQIVERHPTIVQVVSVPLTYVAEGSDPPTPPAITRASGSFVEAGILAGMQLDISGTSSNDRRVTIASVSARKLTLSSDDALTSETVTSTLTAAFFGRGGAPAQSFTPDVPGDYEVTAYGYYDLTGTGTYAGDPTGGTRKQLVGSETGTVHVGGYLDLEIAPVNGHGATLRILAVDDDIGRGFVREAALILPLTELARQAALDSTVAAAVQALVGVQVTNLDVEFSTDVNNLATAYQAHRILTTGSVHASADSTNALLTEAANSVPAAIARLNDLAARIGAHQRAGSSGGTWHTADDAKNTLQVSSTATTLAQAIVLKADLRERVYRRHLAQISSPAAHGAADGTNTPVSALPLPAAIAAFLDFVAGTTVSVPAGEAEGIGDAQAGLGFRLVA